ncbi:hypothetical protein ACHAQF_006268 [Verticillium nonalfalfae]
MSAAAKFECAPYKPFEPDYHPQRPIIVGEEGLDSPETVTLKYEEAVARANGDLRGGSPQEGLLPMSQYGKPQPTPLHGALLGSLPRESSATDMMAGYDSGREYQDSAYQAYGAPTYHGQHHDGSAQLSASQLNQGAFAANSAVGQYMSVGPTVVSCQPSTGMAGAKVMAKVSSQDDLLAMTSPMPYLYLVFGTHKVLAENVKENRDGSGCTLTFTAEAPDIMVTGCQGPSVPLTLLIEAANGEEVSRTAASTFAYHDASLAGAGANPDEITRKLSKSPEQHQRSPRSATTQLGYDSTTNAYNFATAPPQPSQSPYEPTFPQDNNMLSTYRSASFTEQHFPRAAPPPLRPPMAGWQQTYGRTAGPPMTHTHISRPSLTPLPMPTPTTPTLVRTTSLQTSPGSSQGPAYPNWGSSSYSNKAVLNIMGKLDNMAENWTPDEWSNRRRIVMFNKKQTGSTLTTTFRAVNVNERPPNSVCISCIWWAEKNECFVTSVDTIYLLEQLVVAPNRFSVEEKNRIRRNLEGFRPQTVSKAKSDSEEFFKIIMAFPNPKPRNIEKDVKVFPWKILESALKKIIGKYSASPSSTLPTGQMLTPAPVSSYPALPTPPAPTVASDGVNVYGVQAHMHHHDTLTSPRSLSGGNHNWPTYTGAPAHSRALSPALTTESPRQSSGRLSGPLPGVSAYDSRPMAPHAYPGPSMHSSIVHQPTAPTAPGRWDPSAMPSMHPPATYAEQYQPISAHHGPSHPQVYSSNGYNDGAQRA